MDHDDDKKPGAPGLTGWSKQMLREFSMSLLVLFLLVAGLSGCGKDELPLPAKPEAAQVPAAPVTLEIAAGSELRDLEPLFEQLRKETGVTVVPRYMGTLEGAERIASGERIDAAWFSHAKYLMLMPAGEREVRASTRIMLSPVVVGVKADKARQFGWDEATSWEAIVDRAGQNEFRFAMTNPASSNSGFSALAGVATFVAGKSDALEQEDIDSARIAPLLKGLGLVADSSGGLAERYVAEQDNLDGIINYESVLLSLNRSGKLRQPLVLIYPQEGVLTADYQLLLLNNDKRALYEKVVAWLGSEPAQQWIMANTLRRPVNLVMPADKSLFGSRMVVDMAFPGELSVVKALRSIPAKVE